MSVRGVVRILRVELFQLNIVENQAAVGTELHAVVRAFSVDFEIAGSGKLEETDAFFASDNTDISEFREIRVEEAIAVVRFREIDGVDQPAGSSRIRGSAVVDCEVGDLDAARSSDRILIVEIGRSLVDNRDDSVARRFEFAAVQADIAVPFRPVIAPEV